MTVQQSVSLAEQIMAMNNKYDIAGILIRLHTDAKKEGIDIMKEIAVK